MERIITSIILMLLVTMGSKAQDQQSNQKPWFISSIKAFALPGPVNSKNELEELLQIQKNIQSDEMQQIRYWNAGSPGYRWYQMMAKLWPTDTTYSGWVANLILHTSIYDATLVAWDNKYRYKRPRPFIADKRVKLYAPRPESPAYPCEHSVAAGIAVTIISKFYPALKDSIQRMAERQMESRIAAGLVYPSDTEAGFELGKRIALEEIDKTKNFIHNKRWDGNIPETAGWKGKNPLMPLAGQLKTVVLDSASQYRPVPPPDFAKEMEELRAFKQTFRSKANAWHFASNNTGDDLLHKKILEYNLHLDPLEAARIYAAVAVAYYDAFIACFDAKYAYWGIRPEQYDSTYKPLFAAPPFPGYPSGHAVMSGVIAELFPYFFPDEKALFTKIAKDGAESRFHAGIHFRTDNDAGLELGAKVAKAVIGKLESGAERKDNATKTATIK